MELTGHKKVLYIIRVVMYQFFVSIYYPFSLFVGVLFLSDLRDILENVAITFTEIMLTGKCFSIWVHHQRMYKIAAISRKLDKKARLNKDEQMILDSYLS